MTEFLGRGLDPSTEVLVLDNGQIGWVYIADASVGMMILGYSLVQGKPVWEPITEKVFYGYAGPIHQYTQISTHEEFIRVPQEQRLITVHAGRMFSGIEARHAPDGKMALATNAQSINQGNPLGDAIGGIKVRHEVEEGMMCLWAITTPSRYITIRSKDCIILIGDAS